MALKKEIELDNGVIIKYHRITTLNKTINIQNTIEVNSYVNENQRKKEQKYQELQMKNWSEDLTDEEQKKLDEGINVFIDSEFIQIPYDEKMTINSAYEYLKTLPKFEGAEDI